MSGKGRHFIPDLQIVPENLRDLVRKVEDRLVAALAGDQEAVQREIDVLDVDAHQLAHADAGAQKQREDGQIAHSGVIIVFPLAIGLHFAGFDQVQHAGDLVDLQADDRLGVPLGQIHKGRWVGINVAVFVKKFVKTA